MWPNMYYKDFSKDLKKLTYLFQCKKAGKKKRS